MHSSDAASAAAICGNQARLITLYSACLNIGSNHDPLNNLLEAIGLLRQQCALQAISKIYESPAVLTAESGANFLNVAVGIATALKAERLKSTVLMPIEHQLGRIRGDLSDPKTVAVDIDVTLFDQQRLVLGQRQLPDPNIARYLYVAVPLADIAPNYFHADTNEPIHDIVDRLTQQQTIKVRDDLGRP